MAAVQRTVAEAGFASERVQNDYGEDLLVQTQLEGEVDPSRLWIQVKGTANISRYQRQYGYGYSLPVGHLKKWSRSADPVVVVLWDVASSAGWYTYPTEPDFSDTSMPGHLRRSFTLRFDASASFTPDSMRTLAWAARLARFDVLFMTARSEIEFAKADNDEERASLVYGQLLAVGLDVLEMIGLVQCIDRAAGGYQLSERCRTLIHQTTVELAYSPYSVESVDQALIAVSVLVVLQQATTVSGIGLHRESMQMLGEVLAGCFRAAHPEISSAGNAPDDSSGPFLESLQAGLEYVDYERPIKEQPKPIAAQHLTYLHKTGQISDQDFARCWSQLVVGDVAE